MNNTKKRFNIIDFVILVIILGCIAGLVIRFNIVDRIVGITESETKTVHFVARNVSPRVAASLVKGEEFYCADSDTSFGELTEYEKTKGKLIYTDSEGELAIAEDLSCRDISGCFDVEGFESENGFMVGGTQYIAAGKEMVLQSANLQISVIITEIE